jgi:hypothetical protein
MVRWRLLERAETAKTKRRLLLHLRLSGSLAATRELVAASPQEHQRRRGLQTLRQSLAMQQPAAGRRRSYVEIDRNERCILVRITLARRRTTDAKRVFSGAFRSCSPTGPRCWPRTWR